MIAAAAPLAVSSSDGSGGKVLLVVVVLVVMGAIFRWVVEPLARFTIGLLERIADLAVKGGLAIMVMGGVVAAVAVVAAMHIVRT